MTHGSSSSQHPKRLRNTSAEAQEISQLDAKKQRRTMDVFEPCFDTPPLPSKVVLDFESCDERGIPLTAEGLLLRNILDSSKETDRRPVPVNATLGMGGAGKTTALKALCYQEEVKKVYRDGVCFLEFGQNADDHMVIKHVARCVHALGGRNEAQEMNASDNLSDVLERGAMWLRNRTILLVCDDLWSNEKINCGYLKAITRLLREAPESSLVISTRFRNIALSADEFVEFSSLDVEGSKAREILLAGVAGIDARANMPDSAAEDCIRRILRICAGLPLALAIAGRGIERIPCDSNTLSFRVRLYNELIEEKLITTEELDDHPGLAWVIESSLIHCQEWGMSATVGLQYGRKFDMMYMFKGLSVLDKQMVMPMQALKQIWGTNDRCTKAVMDMFADCSLVSCCESDLSTEQEFGLRMHDLVLSQCQQMTLREHSECHERIVVAYAKKIGGDRNFEGSAASQAWWRVHDDGYVFAHLSRHLALSKRALELRSLLCDIRWTLRQIEVGRGMSLNLDFERLFGVENHADRGMRRVHEALMNSLPYARERHNLLAMYICAHLSAEERNELPVSNLLQSICRLLPMPWLLLTRNESPVSSLFQSICRHFPKPWLLPVTRYIAARDRREKWKAVFTDGGKSYPRDSSVDWTRGNVLIANGDSIVSWCTNEHRILLKILHSANRIAVSADGKLIVSGSRDKTVRRWDAKNGAPIGDPLRGHEDQVTTVAVSADGKVILSGSYDRTVRRWDAKNGAPIGGPLRGHEDQVTTVAVSADGMLIVSGSRDKTVRRWDSKSGAPIGDPLRGHEDQVTTVAVSADGKVIVSGSYDRTVRRWNAESGAPIGDPLCGHEDQVTTVALSADKQVIVSGSRDKSVRRWDSKSGASIDDPLRGHEDQVTTVALSADGKSVVSGSWDGTVRGWDVEKDTCIDNLFHGHGNNLSATSVSRDASATAFESNNGKKHTTYVQEKDFHPDSFLAHDGKVTCVAMCADGKVVVSGSDDRTVRRWDAESGAPVGVPLRGHELPVECVAVSADGKVIVSGSWDKTLRRWDAGSGAAIGEPFRGHLRRVTCVAVSADGQLVVSGSRDNTVRRWDAKSGAPIGDPLCGHGDWVSCIAVSPDRKLIVSGSWDGTVRRWDAESGAPVGIPLRGHELPVKCVAISADGKAIVSGSCDKTLRRWDAGSGAAIGDPLRGHEGGVTYVALSDDGSAIMSSCTGRKIRLWDELAPSSVSSSISRQLHRSALEGLWYFAPDMSCLAMRLDGRLVVIGSEKGGVMIFRWVE